jgi:hypothetical protein
MWVRCTCTVLSLMPNSRAISLLGWPRATRSAISRSRSVSCS